MEIGVSGTALHWFKSYLSGRSFKVSWRSEVSKSQIHATGISQGSVFGPLLFSIYMSPLGSVIRKHGFSYYSNLVSPLNKTASQLKGNVGTLLVAVTVACCHHTHSQGICPHTAHVQTYIAQTTLGCLYCYHHIVLLS